MPFLPRVPPALLVLPAMLAHPHIAAAQSAGPPVEARRTLRVAGVDRSYLIFSPSTQHADHPLPLVLVFHGAGATPRGMARHTGFSALAEREGFVVAYPAGIDRRWNDGRGYGVPHDDVAFIRALLDTVGHRLAIDPRRIYATGISNGAMFTYRLACDMPGVFAAIAPVAGAVPDMLAATCAHGAPVSLAAFQGTADRLIPYQGGGVVRRRGRVLSATASAVMWAETDGCTDDPAVTMEPDHAPSDGMRVRRTAYTGCKPGLDVELFTIEGGGHTWPGGPAAGPSVGRVTHDIQATTAIWSFFARHPKP